MPEFCLKKEIEKKLPTNDRFTIALILLCCNFCKKVHEKSEIDKYSKLFVEPLEYYGAAEPPVRCGESHLSGLTEPLRSL